MELPQVDASAGLRRNTLGSASVIFQAVSHLGPAIGIIVVAPAIASFVGASVPLMVLISLGAMMLTGVCVSELARRLPSAGGYYTFVTHGLGKRLGFFTAWAYFLYDPLLPTLTIMVSGGILAEAFRANFGWNIPWWLIVVVLLGLVQWVTVSGIRPSARLTLVLGIVESLIITILAATLLLRHGTPANLAVPFAFPALTHGIQPLVLGFAFGVLLYTGFESAAPLAEETRDPGRLIPRSVILSIVVVGLIWTFASWGMMVGWGVGRASSISTAQNPFFTLAAHAWGVGWLLLAFALLNSSLGAALAGQNAGARVIFALGRSGVLPKAFGRIHPKTRTPVVALTVQTLLNLVLSLGLGFWLGPIGGFTFIGLLVTLGVLIVYGFGNMAVLRLMRTRYPKEWRFWRHGVVPVAGALVLVLGFYFSVMPLPPWPLSLAVWVVGIWLLGGAVLSVVLGKSRSADLEGAARLAFEEADELAQ
ncbi:MAG: APC family permease [Firmicutes bacterium]|nr:APC family permease [Bacillota bacterium]